MQVHTINCQPESVLLGVQAEDDDLEAFVESVFSQKLPQEHARHRTFVIKPNLGFTTDSRGGTTGVHMLEVVLGRVVAQYEPKEIFVTETDGIAFRCEEVFDYLGLPQMVARYGARLLNLSKEPYAPRRFDNNLVLKEVLYPECLHNGESILINLAKPKMHEIARFSGAIKNMFGFNPYIFKMEYHRKINQVLADIYHTFPPNVTIVEGLWSINGHGPWTGTPVYTGFLVGCADSLLADLITLRQIGLEIASVPYLHNLAQEYKIALPDDCQKTQLPERFQWVEASKSTWIKERLACAAVPLFKFGFPLVFPKDGGVRVVSYGKAGRYCRSIRQYGGG